MFPLAPISSRSDKCAKGATPVPADHNNRGFRVRRQLEIRVIHECKQARYRLASVVPRMNGADSITFTCHELHNVRSIVKCTSSGFALKLLAIE